MMTENTIRSLEPGDPGSFDDWPPGFLDQLREMSHRYGYTKLCPICRGHGGWNVVLNQHPLHGNPDTAHHRHLFAHRRTQCEHCNGWGWLHPDDNCPRHQWEKIGNRGRCLHIYRCTGCGVEREIDASD
jgi:DnaJ-class molecular chaperone